MMQELLRRRVPQFLGGYLVAVWGVVQFVSFLEDRYSLPHGLVEMVGAGMLLLIPSVIVVAWGHGSPGPDVWTKRERFLVPFNVVIAIGIAVFLTRGDAALGTMTETIQIQNEEGVVEERQVPAQRLMTRITPFFFDNRSGDEEIDWVGSSVPTLMSVTFLQDLSITMSNPYLSLGRLQEAGHPSGMGAPRALQRRIADQYQSPYYLMGWYDRVDGDFVLGQELVEGGTHRTVGTFEVSGPDLMPLVDQLAEQVRLDLELPEAYRESVVMLPLEEIFTDSREALDLFGRSQLDLVLDNDYAAALEKLQRAVELDPGFCIGHFQVFVVALSGGRGDLVQPAIEQAMESIYRVPEAIQFTVKLNYFYQVEQDGEKALSVGRMWTRLYPDDMDAHGAMLTLLDLAEEYDEAIASVEKLRTLDPTRDAFLTAAAGLYRKKGDYDSALARLREYAERNPEDHESFTAIADLMLAFGRLEEAIPELETASLLAPEDLDVLLSRARIEERLGNLDAADEALAKARDNMKTPTDRYRVLDAIKGTHLRRGEVEEALRIRAEEFTARRESLSPIQVAIQEAMDIGAHREAERLDDLLAVQDEASKVLQGSLDAYAALGRGLLAAERGDVPTLEATLPSMQALVEQQRLEVARSPWLQAQARLAELKGHPEQAIPYYTEMVERDVTSTGPRRELARLHRMTGDPDRARDLLEEALRLDPTHPRLHLEMARVWRDKGNASRGLEHVQKALEVWADADAGYFRAAEARALKEELERSL